MTATFRQLGALVWKDLRIEARTRQTLGLIAVLGLLVVVVLGLGLGANRADKAGSAFQATAVLWVAYLFSGVLCFEKTMSVEKADAAMAGLLMAPLDRSLIYLAKLAGNMVLMLAVALIITPVGVLFFGFDLSAAPGTFSLVMALSLLGFAAVGTLFSAIATSSRLQGGFLAMIIFPVTLPLVISSTQLLMQVFRDGEPLAGGAIGILLAFDAIFLAAGWVLFEWVLEP